jgi:arsenite methyltransferase
MSAKQLAGYLAQIGRVFDIDVVLRKGIDTEQIIDYYTQSEYGYRTFHLPEGSVHMALNYDGVFDRDGYYEQARTVDKHIRELGARQVLELGTGKGFNCVFLARRNPDVQFAGIDLTPLHISLAQRSSKHLENLDFKLGDFQNLDFEIQTFDLLFEVESICHATDMRLTLSEAYRVLKPGGRFIVFDGFRKVRLDDLLTELEVAAKLVEVSMAVREGWTIDDWLETARGVGFSLLKVEDCSNAIMPNLMRFQALARSYFRFAPLAKILSRVLPAYLVKNAIAGLLMPFTLEAGVQGYYSIILERK